VNHELAECTPVSFEADATLPAGSNVHRLARRQPVVDRLLVPQRGDTLEIYIASPNGVER